MGSMARSSRGWMGHTGDWAPGYTFFALGTQPTHNGVVLLQGLVGCLPFYTESPGDGK